MNCFDCKKVEMTLDHMESNDARDLFEIVWKCPECLEVFFATIYRDSSSRVYLKKGEPK